MYLKKTKTSYKISRIIIHVVMPEITPISSLTFNHISYIIQVVIYRYHKLPYQEFLV